MNLHQSILEAMNQKQLDDVEKFADRLFAKIGIDVSFTRHFIERMNDERNGREVSSAELVRIFKKEYEKYGKDVETLDDNMEAVFMDLSSDLNLPFVIRDRRNGKELIAKTIMRKAEFKTNDPTYKVQ
jgi:hypothetical protein